MSSKLNYMAEDDLEYHINFPVPEPFEQNDFGLGLDNQSKELVDESTNSTKPSSFAQGIAQNSSTSWAGNQHYHEDATSEIHRPKTEPVVFLLGWFNAQDRHLAKYSSLYNKLGCITVRYTAPSKDLFGINHVNLKLIAKRLLKLMEDTTLSHHPVIFHNFSNHGSTLYSHISQLMESSSELPLEVVGCIYDSTPAPPRVGSAVKAVYRTTKGSFFRRFLTTTVVCIGLCVWKALSILSTLITGQLPNNPPWCLLQESFIWPQLFLYSKVDDLIPYQDVELFASEREGLGIQVVMHEFIDSPHVMHYKTHPQEYRKVVNDFIQLCLKEHASTETRSFEKKRNH